MFFVPGSTVPHGVYFWDESTIHNDFIPIVLQGAGSWATLHAGVPTENLKIDEKGTLNIC